MATITHSGDAPSRGGSGPVFGAGGRPLKIVTGTITFDSSYPTGGEDVSEVINLFNNIAGVSRCEAMVFDQPLTGAQTGKFAKVNLTTKKVLLYTNASPAVEVANASDQSAIVALPFIAWGPR